MMTSRIMIIVSTAPLRSRPVRCRARQFPRRLRSTLYVAAAGVAQLHREQPDDALDSRLVGELDFEPGEVDLGRLAWRGLEVASYPALRAGRSSRTRSRTTLWPPEKPRSLISRKRRRAVRAG